jgi:Tfp pilus assembly protein FimT
MPVIHGKARNGSIWLRNKFGQRMAVVVNRIGRVRVCEAGKDGCPKPPV